MIRWLRESQIENRDFQHQSLQRIPFPWHQWLLHGGPELTSHPPLMRRCIPSLLRLCQKRSSGESGLLPLRRGSEVTPTTVSMETMWGAGSPLLTAEMSSPFFNTQMSMETKLEIFTSTQTDSNEAASLLSLPEHCQRKEKISKKS